jgi:hypothetical protein
MENINQGVTRLYKKKKKKSEPQFGLNPGLNLFS